MKYVADGSSASTGDVVRLFIFVGMTTDKTKIKTVLKNFIDCTVIISSRTQTSFLGMPRGDGHAYITDRYKVFQNESGLIHMNQGWVLQWNGYYLAT